MRLFSNRFAPVIALITASFVFFPDAHSEGGRKKLDFPGALSITWPRDLKGEVEFLPSFSGYRVEGRYDEKDFSVWITRTRPETIANRYSVERVWKTNLSGTAQLGEVTKDGGCKELEKASFRCESTAVTKRGDFITQSMIWQGAENILTLRVAAKNAEHSKVVYGQFSVNRGLASKKGSPSSGASQ